MNILKLFILCNVFIIQMPCLSQDLQMNEEVTEIISLGKEAIEELALNLLSEGATAQNFSRVDVWTDGQEVYVSLRNPIKYLPVKSIFYCDALVKIIEKSTSYSTVSNEMSDGETFINWYQANDESRKVIHFIFDKMNNDDKTKNLNLRTFNDDMTIRENLSYYDVVIISDHHESTLKIRKESGEIFDIMHATLEPTIIDKISNKKTIIIE